MQGGAAGGSLNRYSARVQWQSGTARLLPRLIGGRTSGPLFLAQALDRERQIDPVAPGDSGASTRKRSNPRPARPNAVGSFGPEHALAHAPASLPKDLPLQHLPKRSTRSSTAPVPIRLTLTKRMTNLGLAKPRHCVTRRPGLRGFSTAAAFYLAGRAAGQCPVPRCSDPGDRPPEWPVCGLLRGQIGPKHAGQIGRSSPCARRHARGPARPPMGAPG